MSLIPPQFSVRSRNSNLRCFLRHFRNLHNLDQFDLDEQFASERARLAQVTNKCAESDLKYFIRECGEILNITSELKDGENSEKHVLEHVMRKLVHFKKLDQSSGVDSTVAKDPIKSSHRDVMLQHYAKSAGSNSNSEWKESEDRLVLREGK